jgi:hypothetical protein
VFTLGDMGVGECAGEVVSLFAMEIAKAEAEEFGRWLHWMTKIREADLLAYRAMQGCAPWFALKM